MGKNKYNISYEPRFLEDEKFLVGKFGYFLGTDIKSSISWIQNRPIPPQTPEWHKLKEFCSKEKLVGTYAIIEDNRIVYEFFPKKKLIVFTNCLDHLYRDTLYYHNTRRLYSDAQHPDTKLIQEVFTAEDKGDYELSYKLNELINLALEYGSCEIKRFKVISDEKGIRIYDKPHNGITYVKIVGNEFYLFTE